LTEPAAYAPTYDWAGLGEEWDGTFLSESHERALELVESIPGMLYPADAQKLYELAWHAEGPILEIGTHKGRSTVLLATAQRDSGKENLVVTMDISHDFLAEARATIAAAGLGPRVVVVQGTRGALAGALPPMTPALVFVDGDHTYDGVARDLAALEAIVPAGGVIAMHDFGGYEAEDPFWIQVEAASRDSWMSRDCEDLGRAGLLGLFRRVKGGPDPAGMAAPLALTWTERRAKLELRRAHLETVARFRVERLKRRLGRRE
jgi:predicted O-methyltransferase YrrM